MARLTQRVLETLRPRTHDYFLWDDDPHGFGVRVWPSGRKAFVVKYRLLHEVHDRRYTLGATTVLRVQAARVRAKDFLALVRQGHDPVAAVRARTNPQTLGDLLTRYQAEVLPKEGPSSQSNQRIHCRFWGAQLGHVPLAALTTQQVAQARSELLRRRKGSTANRYLSTLSVVCRLAVREWGCLQSNPCAGLARAGESPIRVRWLDEETELPRLLDACRIDKHPSIALIVLLAIATGARKKELLRLRWTDVVWDRDQAHLRVFRSKSQRWDQVTIRGTVVALLATHRQRVQPDIPWVFPDPSGTKPLCLENVWMRVRRVAGLTDFRFHDLRHTFASYLAMSGATAREIAEALGDNTLAMAMRYSHLSTAHTAQVVTRMQAAFLGTPVTLTEGKEEHSG